EPCMVPADGRDVQCSNCGTTWFQEGRRRDAAPSDRPVRRAAEDASDAAIPELEVEAPRRGATADEETLEILRQERAHEARQRAAARRRQPSLEAEIEEDLDSIGDLSLGAESRAEAAAERRRMAEAAEFARSREAEEEAALSPSERMRRREKTRVPQLTDTEAPPDDTEDVAEAIAAVLKIDAGGTAPTPSANMTAPEAAPGAIAAAAATGGASARRELLPDIEEINSSLRPDDRVPEAAAVEDAQEVPAKGSSNGFRIGFLAIMAVVLVLVLLYVFHGPLGEAVPALAGTLEGYAAWVDQQRVTLERSVEGLTESILRQTE
ncbi:MAG: hypothetical protein AAFQ50_08460, partial [Pseudomonadota bacterium]